MANKKKILLLVEWGDAWGKSGWTDFDDAVDRLHGDLGVTSVGFLVKNDKKGISLAHGFSELDTPLGVSFIPKGMIKRTKRIKW